MRVLLSALVLSLYFGSALWAQKEYRGSKTRDFDLIHTDLDLRFDFQNSSMEANASLWLSPYYYEQDQVVLDAKGLIIHKVEVNEQAVPNFSHENYQLFIPLTQKVSKEDTLKVEIAYSYKSGEVDELDQAGMYFVKQPMQVWTEGETSYNSCWFPTIDQPNEKHTQRIAITLPDSLKSLSNGLLTNSIALNNGFRQDIWKQEIPHAVYLTMIAAGNFEKIIDERFNRFEVSYYVEPQFKDVAKRIFGNTPEMINFFENLLGVPYPWEKYSQIAVRDYVSGAMENTSATVHNSSIQKHLPQLIDQPSDGIIAHELFHHWFGNLVTCESWANLSLNEGFADYAEYLWAYHKYGKQQAQWLHLTARNRYFEEASQKPKPLLRYHYEKEEELFDAHTYEKAGRVLHMLRNEVGDTAFFESLKHYLREQAYKSVEVNDLRQAFEKVTGRDLSIFFEQWFIQPAHPHLQIEHKVGPDHFTLHIQQTQKGAPKDAFRFTLDILYKDGNELIERELKISEADESFKISLKDSLAYLIIDPNAILLAEIDHKYSNEDLLTHFNVSDFLAPRLEAFNKLTYVEDDGEGLFINPLQEKNIREMVLTALEDPVWQIRNLAAQQLSNYDGDDFLIVEKKLQSLIRTDSHSQVRASAILAMKNFLNPQNDLLFRNALEDSTYLVQGAALSSILANNPPDADSLAFRYKDVNDPSIFGSVADYLADQGKPEDLQWFIKKLSSFEDLSLYQVFGTFGSFLVQTDKATQLKAIPFLKNMAITHKNWIIRFQAGQNLMLISDLPLALQALNEVKTKEKDERALKLYTQFDF